MFVDRVKNDPKFRAAAFKLQSEIGKAHDPGNLTKTYFGVNEGLELDTRTKGEDSRFEDDEVEGMLKEHEVGEDFKQQEDEDKSHPRYDQVRVIAQSIAFTKATTRDVRSATKLVNEAYNKGEVKGSEAFRHGDIVDESTMSSMISDPTCNVLLAEVPNGKDVVRDGTILAVCVYSVGEDAGVIPGSNGLPGAIRFLAVRPSYLGLCVGARMIDKAERNMVNEGVGKVVLCVPSSRRSVEVWAGRRGYVRKCNLPYPTDQVPFQVREDKKEGLRLVVMEKNLRDVKVKGDRIEGGNKGRGMEKVEKGNKSNLPNPPNSVKLSIFEEAEAAMRGISFKATKSKNNTFDVAETAIREGISFVDSNSRNKK